MSDLKNPQSDEDLKRCVAEQLDALDQRGKQEVLDFSRRLATVSAERGGALLAFAGSFSTQDLDEIEHVIEEEFEQVDVEEW